MVGGQGLMHGPWRRDETNGWAGRGLQLKGDWDIACPANSSDMKASELVSKAFQFGCFSRGAFGHWLSQLSFYSSPFMEGFLRPSH